MEFAHMVVLNWRRELAAALRKTGYDERKRSFTPKQVKLIFEYLGEP